MTGARRPVVGVMGSAEAAPRYVALARELGRELASRGWVVLTGGRDAGVMAAAAAGAREIAGSLTVGILPDDRPAGPDIDLAIRTGLGNARNAVNVLTSAVVIACGVEGPGTASEVALALKAGRPTILLAPTPEAEAFFRQLGPADLQVARSVAEAIAAVARVLDPDPAPPARPSS